MEDVEMLRKGFGGRKIFIVFCLLLFSGVMGGWMTGDKAMDGHECFVSVTAREMLLSGDWVVPRYNGEARLQKTPLNYWLVACIGKVTGRVDETATRLPSVFLGILLTAGILYFVSKQLSFRTSLICAAVWLTSLGFVRYGRRGRPEMALTCFVTLSLLSFYTGINETSRRRQIIYMIIFWLSFSLGMLAKGPAPVLMVFGPVLFYFLWSGEWKKIRLMLPLWGMVIFLVVFLPWPILVMKQLAETAGESDAIGFWKREFVDRFFGAHDAGQKPVYYYIPHMFGFCVPWVVFGAMSLAAPFYKVWGQRQKFMKFLWLWLVVDVVLMSISGGKRMHYILPAMPAMAVLVGVLLEEIALSQKIYTARFGRNILMFHIGVALVCAVGGPVFIWKNRPEMLLQILLLAIALVVFMIVVIILLWKGKKGAACAGIFASYGILVMAGLSLFLAGGGKWELSRRFGIEAAEVIGSSKAVAYKDVTSRFVHYFGRGIVVVEDVDEIRERYNDGEWVVATGVSIEELAATGDFRVVKRWAEAEIEKDEKIAGAVFHK